MKTKAALATAGLTVLAVVLGVVPPTRNQHVQRLPHGDHRSGSGTIEGATTGAGQGTFVVQGTANVHITSPNTLFTIQRYSDPNANGNCDLSGGALVLGTFETSNGGAGGGHFTRSAPIPQGQTFDILFEVVGADGTVLQSPCFTVTVK